MKNGLIQTALWRDVLVHRALRHGALRHGALRLNALKHGALRHDDGRNALSMRHILSSITLALALCLSLPASAFDVAALESPGGIAFLHVPLPDSDTVSIHVTWPSDWVHTETAVGAGYIGSQLMIAGGAGERDALTLQQSFEELKIQGVINVHADYAIGVLTMQQDDVDEAVALGSDVLSKPLFDERWFARIRDGFEANIRESNNRPDALAGQTLRKLLHGETGLDQFLSAASPLLATNVTLDDVRRWHADTFVRANMTVVVAGGIDATRAAKAVDTLLAKLQAGKAKPATDAGTANFSPRSVVLSVPDADVGLAALVGSLPPSSSGGEFDDLVAMIILGNGENSRLFDAVRTRLRAAYSTQAFIDPQTANTNALVMVATVDPDKSADALNTMRETYRDLRENGPTEQEVTDTVAMLRAGMLENASNSFAMAQSVSASARDGYPPERAATIMDELDAVNVVSVTARLAESWPAADGLIDFRLTPDPAPDLTTDPAPDQTPDQAPGDPTAANASATSASASSEPDNTTCFITAVADAANCP